MEGAGKPQGTACAGCMKKEWQIARHRSASPIFNTKNA
jgi:hypothetical protein